MKLTGNEPAMPAKIDDYDDRLGDITRNKGGLTIRQQFAAMAMQPVISNHGNPVNDAEAEYISAICVQMADSLIKELNKEKP